MSSTFIPSRRDYYNELSLLKTNFTATKTNPLNVDVYRDQVTGKNVIKTMEKKNDKNGKETLNNNNIDDPLRVDVGKFDPLRVDPLRVDSIENNKNDQPIFEEWIYKRPNILKKYTTNTSIPVIANFLEDKVMQESKPIQVDQAKGRMELLTAIPEQQKQMMTQKEYIYNMEVSHDTLKKNWETGERVAALKIAIQSAKLLGDISVPQFYPSAYVLITDILDTFGTLVYERLKLKGGNSGELLQDNFISTGVSLDAKEVTRNWFYKTACIRELLPRFYVELALIRCYKFLFLPSEFAGIIKRLSRMIRGIGDPLAAHYARCYLCTKAREMVPETYQEILFETFNDYLYAFKQLRDSKFKNVAQISGETINVFDYLDLFTPATQWIVQNTCWETSPDVFTATLRQFKDHCNSSSVLIHILSCFPPRIVSSMATTMTGMIRDSDESKTPKSRLYHALGAALIAVPPPKEQRLTILNDVWKVVAKIQNPEEYVEISQIFIEFLLQHFSAREINILLADVIKHVKKDNSYKNLQPQLQLIVSNVLKYRQTFDQLLQLDNFMPLLDLLERDYKYTSCKAVLEVFSKQKPTDDAVIIQTAFEVARGLHDSIDSLTFEDERRVVSQLIIQFIRKIDFGHDLEQQLSVYVECRAAFTNLDAVTKELVMRVSLLCMTAHRFVKGKHSKKTAAFVKACLSFCHITIPSLDDVFLRLNLLVESAQVALVNQMVGQSEGLLKAAISLIPETPATIERDGKQVPTDQLLIGFLSNFSSLLLLFPGHPEHGPFHLVKGLLNVVNSYAPWSGASESKTKIYLSILVLFCTYSQVKFPYHIEKVESNDTLYGGEASYMEELLSFIDKLIEEILSQLASIGEKGDLISLKQQGTLALDLVNILATMIQMNGTSATMVVKLYGLAKKSNAVEKSYLSSTLSHIQSKRGVWYQDLAAKLLQL